MQELDWTFGDDGTDEVTWAGAGMLLSRDCTPLVSFLLSI